jgi:hypothetical protein
MIIFIFRVKGDAMGNSDKVVGGMALYKDSGTASETAAANAPPPLLFGRRWGALFLFLPPARGAERREALSTSRTLRRRGASLAIGMPASRRSTCGSRHQLSPWLSSGPGFRARALAPVSSSRLPAERS